MKTKILYFLLLISFGLSAQRLNTENVVLITLDGLRWQEVFTGADKTLIGTKEFVSDSLALVKKFWNESPEKRRETLMPFLWTKIASEGQLYGNRNVGNNVNVTNKMWFSYPGYSEILTGAADDERINSNDKNNNPNVTVLEFLNNQDRYKGKVAAFASWDCFPYIINAERSGLYVNSGIVKVEKAPTIHEALINELMYEIPNPLGSSVRLDAFTFHYTMEYLKKNKPRILYISFDETDDFAHGGKYDLYLEAAHYTDNMIGKLWNWLQTEEQYKDKTTLIITVDHGRGFHDKDAWRHHGSKVPNTDQIWIAIMGPDTPSSGEVKSSGQLYQNQIAKTLAMFLGLNFENGRIAGNVIPTAFVTQP
jgi:hypothetical protein